jgi:hypothetical protein
MEGHLLMIDCEKISCKIFLFGINILSQMATLDGVVVVSLFEGFNHVKTSVF